MVEAGLGHLPFHEKTVQTPTGSTYVGVDFSRSLCGVSVIRSGEAMENALRSVCKGVKIGKILIHRRESDKSKEVRRPAPVPAPVLRSLRALVRLPKPHAPRPPHPHARPPPRPPP